jgi:hypothetical protein
MAISCSLCNNTYIRIDYLKAHVRRDHNNNMPIVINSPKQFSYRNHKMQQFMQLMANRLAVGAFRHQEGKDEFGHPSQDYFKRLKKIIKKFEDTGNLELLVDVADYCALEFYNSLHPNQHFKSEDSNGRTTLNQENI